MLGALWFSAPTTNTHMSCQFPHTLCPAGRRAERSQAPVTKLRVINQVAQQSRYTFSNLFKIDKSIYSLRCHGNGKKNPAEPDERWMVADQPY